MANVFRVQVSARCPEVSNRKNNEKNKCLHKLIAHLLSSSSSSLTALCAPFIPFPSLPHLFSPSPLLSSQHHAIQPSAARDEEPPCLVQGLLADLGEDIPPSISEENPAQQDGETAQDNEQVRLIILLLFSSNLVTPSTGWCIWGRSRAMRNIIDDV